MNTRDLKTLEKKMKIHPDLCLKKSGIVGAGLGIFAKKTIKAGCILGKYEGEYFDLMSSPYVDDAYAWGIQEYDETGKPKKEKVIAVVTSYKADNGNWTRFVNGSRDHEEANVENRQNFNIIEYWSKEDILKGHELLIYYGHEYNEYFGVR